MGYLQGKLVRQFSISEPSHLLAKYLHLFLLSLRQESRVVIFFLYQGEYLDCVKGNGIHLVLPFISLCGFFLICEMGLVLSMSEGDCQYIMR